MWGCSSVTPLYNRYPHISFSSLPQKITNNPRQFLTGHLEREVASLTQVRGGSASSSHVSSLCVQICAPLQTGVGTLLLPLAPGDKAQGVRLQRLTLWVAWLSGGSALWPPWLGHNKNHLQGGFQVTSLSRVEMKALRIPPSSYLGLNNITSGPEWWIYENVCLESAETWHMQCQVFKSEVWGVLKVEGQDINQDIQGFVRSCWLLSSSLMLIWANLMIVSLDRSQITF